MAEVHLIARLVSKPGKEDELRKLLVGMIAPTRREPEAGSYELFESDTPGRFYFHEHWPSQAALDKHFESAHFKDLESRGIPLLAEPPELNKLTRLEP